MKIIKNIIHLVLISILISSVVYSQNSFIKVSIVGLESLEGNISIGLFNNPDDFPKRNENSIGTHLEIKDSLVEYTFSGLKDGEYAIAVYHDENCNGEFDRNFLGMPSEDYVFSNYATGSFGPPSFEDAKFTLVDSIKIELNIFE